MISSLELRKYIQRKIRLARRFMNYSALQTRCGFVLLRLYAKRILSNVTCRRYKINDGWRVIAIELRGKL